MKVTVNGEQRTSGAVNVTGLLAEIGIDDLRGVAIAIGEEVVPKSDWESTEISDGDRIEILHAVQGG